MAQFLYYFPGKKPEEANTSKAIKAVGLGNAVLGVGRRRKCSAEMTKGPNGGTGTMLTTGLDEHGACKFKEDIQTWKKCHGGDFWIGFLTDDPPTPAQLEKPNARYVGYPITLGDGRSWRIPAAHFASGAGEVPSSLGLDVDGNRIREILPSWKKLSEYARTAHDGLCNTLCKEGEPVEIDENFKWDAAAEALSVSHFVTKWEVAALGLLTTENLDDVMSSIADFPTYYAAWMVKHPKTDETEAAKKNANDQD